MGASMDGSQFFVNISAATYYTTRQRNRRLGGGAQQPSREVVSFRSCVRARCDCHVEMRLKRHPAAVSLGILPPPPKLLSSFSWLDRV